MCFPIRHLTRYFPLGTIGDELHPAHRNHIEHWADGGETRLSNLATLCRFHHRAVHAGGLKMQHCDDGAWRFFNARGESMYGSAPSRTASHTQPLADWRRLPAQHVECGIHIASHTAITGWLGERMDYGVAIDSLRFRSGSIRSSDHP